MRTPLWLRRLVAVSLVAPVAHCGGELDQDQLEQAVVVCARGATTQGIDVSEFQGTIDWGAVHRAGKQFAIIRVADGTYLDPKFSRNWAGARSAGVIRGVYQFFHPGRDPVVQADFLLAHMGTLLPTDLPPMLDLEVTDGVPPAHVTASVHEWINRIESRLHRHPLIYTGLYFFNDNVRSNDFRSYDLVVAQYGPRCPNLPTPWTQWFMWQYSSTGRVGGISGNVDTDLYNGSLDDLRNAIAGTSTAPSYGASYVTQSWPLAAAAPLRLHAGDRVAAYIELRNTGTAPWNANTRLATTIARDRRSPFTDATWMSANRLDQVTGTVAPGGTYRFRFDFHAPATPGTYDEHYGMVQEGVTWFSAAGQGGPADSVVEARFIVDAPVDAGTADVPVAHPDVPVAVADAGVDGGVAEDVASANDDVPDDIANAESDVPADDDAGDLDDASDPAGDSGTAHAGETPDGDVSTDVVPDGGGCGCAVLRQGHDGRATPLLLLLLLALAGASGRRRRTRPGG